MESLYGDTTQGERVARAEEEGPVTSKTPPGQQQGIMCGQPRQTTALGPQGPDSEPSHQHVWLWVRVRRGTGSGEGCEGCLARTLLENTLHLHMLGNETSVPNTMWLDIFIQLL